MRKTLSLLPALVLIISLGCTPTEKKADVPPPPKVPQQAAPAPAPAPEPAPVQKGPGSAKKIVQDYGTGLVSSVGKAKGTQEKVDTEAIRLAVQNYYSENGKYPASLEDVRGYLKEGTDLGAYNYDPSTGTVSLK